MSALRGLFLLAVVPLLVAADEPGLERATPPAPQRSPAAPPASTVAPAARAAVAAPAPKAVVAASAPKAAEPKAVRVFRFDALRVEGLAGPNALVLHDLQLGRRRSLVKRRRSFLHRMLEAVEVGARGRP